MSPASPLKSPNPIHQRCLDDEMTRMRLSFDPFYHAFSRQRGSHVWLAGREMIMLASNDYLGLSDHPKVIEAGAAALRLWGSGTTGGRPANGSRSCHVAFEEKLAAFVGKEACHVGAAGYLSCMAAVQTFAEKGDLILVDKNVHSSLWAGIHLSHARYERFGHNDPGDLAAVLSQQEEPAPTLLVFEGVYSMEGHIARLPEILAAARAHDCFTVMDDAHGIGVLGDKGRGTGHHFNAIDEIDILCGSLSKSLSSTGGFIAGSRQCIDYLRTHSKQMIFSAAISPAQAACAEAALDLLIAEPEHLERLWANTKAYKRMLLDLGLDIWQSETPAVPIVLGSVDRAYRFWRLLLDEGIFAVISVAPAVPPRKDLVRTSISARHTPEDLGRIGEAMARVVRQM